MLGVRRHILRLTKRGKQQIRGDPRENVELGHPKLFTIRRNQPQSHRPYYQKNEEEVLWDEILQPHFPNSYTYPGLLRFK